jgi:hypothetical protein
MHVNSYHELTLAQFDAAVEYLNGKLDDTSIAAIAAKHFQQLALQATIAPTQPLPAPITPTLITGMVQGGMIDHGVLLELGNAINQRILINACNNPDRGIGAEIAAQVKGMSPADLYAVNVATNMEVWLRSRYIYTSRGQDCPVFRHLKTGQS